MTSSGRNPPLLLLFPNPGTPPPPPPPSQHFFLPPPWPLFLSALPPPPRTLPFPRPTPPRSVMTSFVYGPLQTQIFGAPAPAAALGPGPQTYPKAGSRIDQCFQLSHAAIDSGAQHRHGVVFEW